MQDWIIFFDWDVLVDFEDEVLLLLLIVLLIVCDEYFDLQLFIYDVLIQSYVEYFCLEVESIDNSLLKMVVINCYLFDELGYSGDYDEYYDLCNSYFNQVFECCLGNLILLVLVQMEVVCWLGILFDGVFFFGYFLVCLLVDDGVLVMDLFNGGWLLDVDELCEWVKLYLGGQMFDDQVLVQIFDLVFVCVILMCMLCNLYGVYVEVGEWDCVVCSVDCLLKLVLEQDDVLCDRGLVYLQLEYLVGVCYDLGQYLKCNLEVSDVQWLCEKLIDFGGLMSWLY